MTKQRRNPNVDHSYPGNPRSLMEKTSQLARESGNQESKKILRGSAFSWIPGFQICVFRLAKEALGAFEEALVQRGIFLADQCGELLQFSTLLGVQACRHFHNHARK